MNILDNPIYRQDLDNAIEANPELREIKGKKVFITGATGLIGSAIVDLLLRLNETYDANVEILAGVRDIDKAVRRFQGKSNIRPVLYDATRSNQLNFDVDFIIHGAGNASPDLIVNKPVETMTAHLFGLKELLDYSVEKNVKSIVFISSSEVYGLKEKTDPFSENEYGYIDLLDVRSAYSIAKCGGETLCVSYAHEKKVNVKIVRPGHIYGPQASSGDKRVGSLWAYEAARGNDIVMKSDGSQIRSYCHATDCATAVLTVLLKGENARAYNISNKQSIISIKELARLYSQAGGVNVKVETPAVAEQRTYNPMRNSSLDSELLENIGWKGLLAAEIGTEHTIQIIRGMID